MLDDFIHAVPTAELVPFSESYSQSDEEEMGLTYAQLSVFGKLRKVAKLGPYSAWVKLVHEWGPAMMPQESAMTPREVFEKVKTFFHYYGINRHKMTVVTPSYRKYRYACLVSVTDRVADAEQYSPGLFTSAISYVPEILDAVTNSRLDDNRFDHRPFLYPYLAWPYKKIEEEVKRDEEKKARKQD